MNYSNPTSQNKPFNILLNKKAKNICLGFASILLASCGCNGGSGASVTTTLIDTDEYLNLSAPNQDSLIYDVADYQNNESRKNFNFAQHRQVSSKATAHLDSAISVFSGSKSVTAPYGYSAAQLPVINLYKNGEFQHALWYQGLNLSKTMQEANGDDITFMNELKPINERELSQVLLDNGKFNSASRVVDDINRTLGEQASEDENESQQFYEDIQAMNNKLIAQFLSGNSSAKQDAYRLLNFQSQQNLKYKQTIAEFNKKNSTVPSTLSGQTGKLNQQLAKMDNSKDILKGVKIATPYLNSTADFLYAYAAESQYYNDQKSGNASNWSEVKNAFVQISKNVRARATRNMARFSTRAPSSKYKVVYALVSTGLAPHKEISYSKINFYLNNTMVPVSLSVTNLVNSTPERRYRVFVNKTAVSKIASPAMSMKKYYMDTRSSEWFKQGIKALSTALASGAAAAAINKADDHKHWWSGLLASAGAAAVNHAASKAGLPETTSWTTMPNTIYATRMLIPATQNSIKLTINGKSATVVLSDAKLNFVYARSINDNTVIYRSQK